MPKDFVPCTILLNNDLTGGAPKVVQHLYEQYLLPPLHAGWGLRRKSNHFKSYEEVAKKFAKLLGMDPWLIHPMFGHCGRVDLGAAAGLDCVRTQVDAVLGKVRRKYKEYGINEKPFVVLKADDRADGQGLLTVRDTKDVGEVTRRAEQWLGGGEGEQPVHQVIVQEGVPTYERMREAAAEPVVTMIDRYVVGGHYRTHRDGGVDESLNAPGAQVVPLGFAESHQLPRLGAKPGASAPNRFYMYGVIGRLAMLAASYELEATDPDAETDA